MSSIRYTHTNIIAKEWRTLAAFYTDVFGCEQTGPERDLSGAWIDAMTGITGARVTGAHLRLPGSAEDGPTLEIFSYEPPSPAQPGPINSSGFGHIAFHVDDVSATLAAVLARGGSALGEIVHKEYPVLGVLTAVYARDPEGNIIELQNWAR